MEKEDELPKRDSATVFLEDEVSFEKEDAVERPEIAKEELSIEDLHDDLEKRLHEQGFIFDKKKFIFEDQHLTFGERLADKVASFGGSWTFIIIFGCIIFSWISLNLYWLANKAFDPFPFILLNLVLSCLASLQAPIIMMSQNRQALKDRKQEEINIEKEILDFKQDRLDLILDQKQWEVIKQMDERLRRMEEKGDYEVLLKDKQVQVAKNSKSTKRKK